MNVHIDPMPSAKQLVLQQRWRDCRTCNLCRTRIRNCTFRYYQIGEGKSAEEPTDLLFIGEGPGATEDAAGRPLIGRAGLVLQQAINDAQPDRQQLTIAFANIVACHPTYRTGGPNRRPLEGEAVACAPWLGALIVELNARNIVLLGQCAADLFKYAADSFRLEARHRRPIPGDCLRIWKIYHPSYIARSGGVKSAKYPEYAERIAWIMSIVDTVESAIMYCDEVYVPITLR